MIAALVIGLLAGVALGYALRPLRGGAEVEPQPQPRPLEELNEKKRAALSALLDLEEEREAGKLTAADHQQLRERYESEAVATLRALDEAGVPTPDDDDLEAAIAELRAGLTCPACGALRGTGARCSRCGAG